MSPGFLTFQPAAAIAGYLAAVGLAAETAVGLLPWVERLGGWAVVAFVVRWLLQRSDVQQRRILEEVQADRKARSEEARELCQSLRTSVEARTAQHREVLEELKGGAVAHQTQNNALLEILEACRK